MEIFWLIYFSSVIGCFAFMPWSVDKNISLGAFMFTALCPLLNTGFCVYRTYRHIKSGKSINFLKDLFQKDA